MRKSFYARRIQYLFGIGLFVFLAAGCAAPSGGGTGGDINSVQSVDEGNFTYISITATDADSGIHSSGRSGGFATAERAATFADTFTFNVVCGNDASCLGSPAPSPALSSGSATPKCYNLSSYASGVAPAGTIPLITSDDGTTKTVCRIKLTSFNYKNSGQNYTASSSMVMDLDFRNAGAPTTQTSYTSSGVLYTDSNVSTPGPNLYSFYKYTNTSGASNTAVGTLSLLFSTANSSTGVTTTTGTSAVGTSVADTIQSSTIVAPAISSMTYQMIPASGSMAKQYTVHFTGTSDQSGFSALTSTDSCRIFLMNSAMTQVTINGTNSSATAIPTDLVSAQNLFLDANGNMLSFTSNTDEMVDCKYASNSIIAANSAFFGVLNQWNTSITSPIAGSSVNAVTLTNTSTAKPRLVVIASDATDTSSGAAKKASRAFVMFKIPATTSSSSVW